MPPTLSLKRTVSAPASFLRLEQGHWLVINDGGDGFKYSLNGKNWRELPKYTSAIIRGSVYIDKAPTNALISCISTLGDVQRITILDSLFDHS